MRKKNFKKIIISILSISIALVVGIFIGRITIGKAIEKTNDSSSESTSEVVNVDVSTQTIEKTLTSSGQISSSSSEKISLDTDKSFEMMCVEQDDLVSAGENILKYTDGTYLTAEYDCVISSYLVPEAEGAVTSSNYVEVQNMETLSMTLNVDESEINSVAVGQEVEIQLTADEEKTYTGKISKINATGTYSSAGSSFTAVVEFENDGNVKIGMSASCTVILEKAENVISVPVAAVQTKGEEEYVVVVNSDGTTEKIVVETGLSNDSYVEIKSGLTGNEQVQMVQITSNRNNKMQRGSQGNMSMPSGGGEAGFPGGGEPGGGPGQEMGAPPDGGNMDRNQQKPSN